MKEDKRKFNGGTKGNKGGRPRKLPIVGIIEKQCQDFIIQILEDERVKKECINQINNNQDKIKDKAYIYIIKSNNLYKIGITSNLKNRYNQYQSHSGYKSKLIFSKKINNANDTEKLIINKYKEYCTQGDWFDLADCNIVEIVSIISNQDLN